MALPVHDLESEALQLPQEERARLAKTLLLSLDSTAEGDVDQVWAEEAMYRYREIERGEVPTFPSDEVFREARALLK
ncbi:MAG TPA: addiction module protein [Thermoanaerobaculia bacterium]|nr:addiction module protein [Thermoanaerobaculia bacterium]